MNTRTKIGNVLKALGLAAGMVVLLLVLLPVSGQTNEARVEAAAPAQEAAAAQATAGMTLTVTPLVDPPGCSEGAHSLVVADFAGRKNVDVMAVYIYNNIVIHTDMITNNGAITASYTYTWPVSYTGNYTVEADVQLWDKTTGEIVEVFTKDVCPKAVTPTISFTGQESGVVSQTVQYELEVANLISATQRVRIEYDPQLQYRDMTFSAGLVSLIPYENSIVWEKVTSGTAVISMTSAVTGVHWLTAAVQMGDLIPPGKVISTTWTEQLQPSGNLIYLPLVSKAMLVPDVSCPSSGTNEVSCTPHPNCSSGAYSQIEAQFRKNESSGWQSFYLSQEGTCCNSLGLVLPTAGDLELRFRGRNKNEAFSNWTSPLAYEAIALDRVNSLVITGTRPAPGSGGWIQVILTHPIPLPGGRSFARLHTSGCLRRTQGGPCYSGYGGVVVEVTSGASLYWEPEGTGEQIGYKAASLPAGEQPPTWPWGEWDPHDQWWLNFDSRIW